MTDEIIQIHKKGNKVMIFSETGTNITSDYPEIESDFKTKDNDFIINGRIQDQIFYLEDLKYIGMSINNATKEYKERILNRLIDSKNIRISNFFKQEFIKPLKPLVDTEKPESNEFFTFDDFNKMNRKNKLVEKKYDGLRMQVHKSGNSVRCYSAHGNLFANKKLGSIPEEIKKIKSHRFILDGELIIPHQGHKEVHDAITEKGSEDFEYQIFDILAVNDKSLVNKRLFDRKKILQNIKDSDHVKQVKYLVFSDIENLEQLYHQVYDAGHEGIVIKELSSDYTDNRKWWKFVFAEKLIRTEEQIHNMTEDELKDYRISLNRMSRKLKENKSIPMSNTDLLDQWNTVSERLQANDFEKWSETYKNNLPDESFLYIDPQAVKDELGLSKPRYMRYIPIKDQQGKIDMPHVLAALRLIDRTKAIPDTEKEKIKEKLRALQAKSKQDHSVTKTITFSVKALNPDKDFSTKIKKLEDISFPYHGATVAFAEGTWHECFYSWEVIRRAAPLMVGLPVIDRTSKETSWVPENIKYTADIVLDHSDDTLDNIGFVSQVSINDEKKQIEIEFEILDTSKGKDAALLWENNQVDTVSVRLTEDSEIINGREVCTEIYSWPHVSLTPNPEVTVAKKL